MGSDTIETEIECSHQTGDSTKNETPSLPVHQVVTATSINYNNEKYKYAAYLPYSTPGRQPALVGFVHVDVGLRADPEKPNLFNVDGAKYQELTLNIGTEIHGIQLSQLSPEQLDELALLAAERGVVIFKGQDFADIGPEKQKKYGAHFGHLHVHQMGTHIKNFPEILPVYRDAEAGAVDKEIANSVSSVKWHSDMTYEINGMGTTTFFPLDTPSSGGDTLYLSTTAAYYALSPIFREKLHSLSATNSGVQQYNVTDGEKRHIRAPIETVHPVVRTHPATKTNSLYVNRLYTKRIVGLKEEESFYLLNFLFDHIERGQDWHLRIHWTPGTVAVYDNRVTQHSALRDFKVEAAKTRRHMVRITPQAERPVFVDPLAATKNDTEHLGAGKGGIEVQV